ncbi:MAG: 2,3,4,5-tetrahydropyridine-2,6-dicarboxylate N-succinyltransferase, partial [Alphaproteobacteria bacterium]|nr:2,3,4,5-tetrahydropyridine-2,6-dicarboxylate N-succinyltransferase [Alphaproteobacteria bacterium]
MTPSAYETIINEAFANLAEIKPDSADPQLLATVEEVLQLLDSGALRVAERRGDHWHVNQWLKKTVLLSFRLQ